MTTGIQQPAQIARQVVIPADFHFSIGGCFDGYCRLDSSEKLLTYQPAGHFGSGEMLVMPSQRKWQNFYKKLAEAKVRRWRRYYNDPHVLDGTQWEFRLKTADLKIETGGSNADPTDEQWAMLLQALRNLTGKKVA